MGKFKEITLKIHSANLDKDGTYTYCFAVSPEPTGSWFSSFIAEWKKATGIKPGTEFSEVAVRYLEKTDKHPARICITTNLKPPKLKEAVNATVIATNKIFTDFEKSVEETFPELKEAEPKKPDEKKVAPGKAGSRKTNASR